MEACAASNLSSLGGGEISVLFLPLLEISWRLLLIFSGSLFGKRGSIHHYCSLSDLAWTCSSLYVPLGFQAPVAIVKGILSRPTLWRTWCSWKMCHWQNKGFNRWFILCGKILLWTSCAHFSNTVIKMRNGKQLAKKKRISIAAPFISPKSNYPKFPCSLQPDSHSFLFSLQAGKNYVPSSHTFSPQQGGAELLHGCN